MNDPRQQHGDHTWDIIIKYHRCPKCGTIIEDRFDYEYRLGKYQKDLFCEVCEHHFTVTKPTRPAIGPLWGG